MTTTATKERPIIFSTDSVKAILDGRKTMTRRVVKPQPDDMPGITATYHHEHGLAFSWPWTDSTEAGSFPPEELPAIRCPYGAPGDILYVKECWASPGKHRVAYRADGECGAWLDDGGTWLWIRHGGIVAPEFHRPDSWRGESFGLDAFGGRWRSPIHMPRWASRLTLELTHVRVERLQEISQEDAIAEGVRSFGAEMLNTLAGGNANLNANSGEVERLRHDPVACFREAWDALNAKRGFPWVSNNWVWVLEYRRIEQ